MIHSLPHVTFVPPVECIVEMEDLFTIISLHSFIPSNTVDKELQNAPLSNVMVFNFGRAIAHLTNCIVTSNFK